MNDRKAPQKVVQVSENIDVHGRQDLGIPTGAFGAWLPAHHAREQLVVHDEQPDSLIEEKGVCPPPVIPARKL